MMCTRCDKLGVRKFAYSSAHFDYKGAAYKINLCNSCAFIVLNQLFDHIDGDAYNNLIRKIGKPIHTLESKNASSIQKDGRSNEKTIRPKKRRKNRKHDLEQKNERNRKNRRKRSPLSGASNKKFKKKTHH